MNRSPTLNKIYEKEATFLIKLSEGTQFALFITLKFKRDSNMDKTLGTRQVRMVYLLTYSQADANICISREDFASKVTNAFNSVGAHIIQWACCREYHQDGSMHYHMAIKLDRPHRWLQVKKTIEAEHGIIVHFLATHANYYSAWQYVTKEDDSVITSPHHPDIGDHPPATTSASASRVQATSSGSSKKTLLSELDVFEIVIKRRIKTTEQLLVLAEQQKREGKTDLAEFVVIRGAKCVAEAIKNVEAFKASLTPDEQKISNQSSIQEEKPTLPSSSKIKRKDVEPTEAPILKKIKVSTVEHLPVKSQPAVRVKVEKNIRQQHQPPVKVKKEEAAAPSMKDVLPEGFFDDPTVDAKVRQVEVKNTAEEEWAKFQKEMEHQQQASQVMLEADETATQVSRNITEIDEQIQRFAKVEKLRDEQDKWKETKLGKPHNKMEESGSSGDEEDYAEFLDWRSKGAFK
ncbi:hypothetical protein HOLleu_20705 [Holothuria leucospilota]|uniref:CRESS-DNA virus Rep endonuclease domain-containing protein n=1 Tax=Holothuria leucospilota TaxID=206669 RepID=A0A9Q1C146_HOLLE|nr:hypothetical protein HOLleu_20705 [Holothuria leucospilota]